MTQKMNQTTNTTPLSRQQATALVDAISANEGMVLTASAFEDENGEWVFEATSEVEPDLDAFSELARQTLGGKVAFSAEKIDPEIDWVAKSLSGLPPVIAGGFFIHAGHNGKEIPPQSIPIHIEAAQAFGTGHHETTTACLEAIYLVLKNKQPKSILDLGTGTGVLAIALAKRLKTDILASDIDPVAVQTASRNAKLNNVGEFVRTVEATGFDAAPVRERAPYDLIVANILAGPLAELAPEMKEMLATGAALILSGILTTQAPNIIAAYEKQNIFLKHRILLKEWTTLVLEKA